MSNDEHKVRTGGRGPFQGNVLALGLVSLFTDLSSEMMNPLLPIFLAGLVPLGLAPVYVGLMEGVAETTASLLKLISGRLSDYLGRRKMLVVLGYGLSTCARPLMALAGLTGTAWAGGQVVGLKFLDRVGKGVRTSPRDALISDSVGPETRGLAFSFTRAMDHAGAVGGSLLAIVILFAFLGYGLWRSSTAKPTLEEITALRWVFALALLPGALALITLAWKVREIKPKSVARASCPCKDNDTQSRDDPAIHGQDAHATRLPTRFFAFVGIVVLFTLGNSSDMFLLLYAWETFGLGLRKTQVDQRVHCPAGQNHWATTDPISQESAGKAENDLGNVQGDPQADHGQQAQAELLPSVQQQEHVGTVAEGKEHDDSDKRKEPRR